MKGTRMSLLSGVRSIYDDKPAPSTPEAELTGYWLKPKDWVALEG